MRIVFFGAGDFAVPSLRALANSEHEIALVVTQPDRPAGRGKKLLATPVAQQAQVGGHPLVKCPEVNDPSFIDRLAEEQAQIGVVIDFGQKLRQPVREVFPSECVNLHGSLLPKYRGAAPVVRAILAGEIKTGVTVFRLVDRMDAGPVLLRRETQIGPYESHEELHGRLARIGCDAIKATLELYKADPLPTGEEQDETQACPAPKLRKAEGHLDFSAPAEAILRRVRAMNPWPGAKARYVPNHGTAVDVTIREASAAPGSPTDAEPGTITDVLTVVTGAGTLEIHGIQPAGKKDMSWQDFVNGRHVSPGDRFVSLDE